MDDFLSGLGRVRTVQKKKQAPFCISSGMRKKAKRAARKCKHAQPCPPPASLQQQARLPFATFTHDPMRGKQERRQKSVYEKKLEPRTAIADVSASCWRATVVCEGDPLSLAALGRRLHMDKKVHMREQLSPSPLLTQLTFSPPGHTIDFTSRQLFWNSPRTVHDSLSATCSS